MPKTKIQEWDTTAANNTDINSINIAEGCDAANLNNSQREFMAQIATALSGADDSIITGTAGATGNLGAFNADGDLVAAGTITGTLDFSGATVTGISAVLSDGDYGDVTVSSSGSVISLDAGVVDTAELAASAVTAAKIADGAVTAAKLANADFGDFTVSAGVATLDAGVVDTAELADGAVTAAKLASGAGGGATLLGTLTTTSGSSQSLTGQDLTGYKFVRFVFDGVSTVGSTTISVGGQSAVGDASNNSATWRGIVEIDLATGVGTAVLGSIGGGGSTAATEMRILETSLSTASTTLTVATDGTLDAGSVKVYGIA